MPQGFYSMVLSAYGILFHFFHLKSSGSVKDCLLQEAFPSVESGARSIIQRVGRVFALHSANPDTIPSITYGSPKALPKLIPEHREKCNPAGK